MDALLMDQSSLADFEKIRRLGVHINKSMQKITLLRKDGTKIVIFIDRMHRTNRLAVCTTSAELKKVWAKK